VHVRSDDPKESPAIQFNVLASEADKKAALAGLKYSRKMSQAAPLSDCTLEEVSPGLERSSDEALLEHCRNNGLSLLHPVGTSKMGIDKTAVVDPRLRVIDASIMPTIVSANNNAASIMIGEKGAEMVIDDWQS
jgi:choline dehydrogenase